MKNWIGPVIAGAVLALVTHAVVVIAAPGFIMDRAMSVLKKRGSPLHDFGLSPRMTAETQTVVRPSPDLAYSLCRFDLDQAEQGLRVRMAAYDNYSSISFFDSNTNNFLTLRGEGQAREAILLPPGAARTAGPPGGLPEAVVAPNATGVILIRRLAPTQQAYDTVAEIAPGDLCQPL